MQDLFSLTGETAHLAVRAGHEVLYIDRVYGSKRVPRAGRVGGRLPMHATAVGKVILAFEEEWVRDAYLNRQLERHTAHTHVDPKKLAAELAQIREQGYATTLEECAGLLLDRRSGFPHRQDRRLDRAGAAAPARPPR